MTSPYLMAGKHASFYSGFFCSNSNKCLILNCRGNGNVAKLYLKQQAENKSTVHAAKGDLGRYRDKTKNRMWLRFCHRIKCKMENIVPIVEILQSTISEIKRHPYSTLTFRSCVIAMDWIMIFVHDQCRFSEPEWSEAGGIPEGDLRPFTSTVRSPSITVHLPSPPPPILLTSAPYSHQNHRISI